MYQIEQTEIFKNWLRSLEDVSERAYILLLVRRASMGYLVEAKSVGGGVFEINVRIKNSYRIYYKLRGRNSLLYLCGSMVM